MSEVPAPPLSVYIHWPWCLKRCSYCDFHAHPVSNAAPLRWLGQYMDALSAELRRSAEWLAQARERLGGPAGSGVLSVYFGGGTPSLLPATAVQEILQAVDTFIGLAEDAEVTLEANPGAAEHDAWGEYRKVGVNRLSLGVQSLDDDLLGRLGRIHDARIALQAIEAAQEAGFARLNADLMYGLPGQTVSLAHSDVQRLLDLGVKHLSHYHLTLESATPLGRAPPGDLPDEQSLLAMEGACRAEMAAQGLDRYEVSAFAAAGQQCRHNLNYWTYGDYLGIGPGAHGKLTLAPGEIVRQVAADSPQRWMQVSGTDQAIAEQWVLSRDEVVFELFANGLRMPAGISPCTAEQNTGWAWRDLERRVAHLLDDGWLEWNSGRLSVAESRFEMLDTALESLITAS